MRCLLAESSSSSAPKQMRERGRWFPMYGQEKAPPKRGQSSRIRGRWSSATKQFATRGLVPERKAPPKRGNSWKKIKMKTQLPRGCFGASVAQTLSKSEKNGQIG